MGGGAQAAMGVAQVWQAKKGSDAEKLHSQYEARQMEFNAQMLDMRAEEVNVQAEKDIVQRQSDISRMLGTQKVSVAAQGIELDSEVALQIKEETERIGREDVMAIKNNAWKQAWGMEVESADMRSQADFTRQAGKSRARSTLVTGGLQGLSNVYSGAGKMSFGSGGRASVPTASRTTSARLNTLPAGQSYA